MADNRKKNNPSACKFYIVKRVFVKLNVESPVSSVSPTRNNFRKLSTNFASCFMGKSMPLIKTQVLMLSPHKSKGKIRPEISLGKSLKMENCVENTVKLVKLRELSKSFVINKTKFLEKVACENLKLGVCS